MVFKKQYHIRVYIFIAISAIFAATAYGGTVVGSKHDLSSTSSPDVCVFCHVPHHANPSIGPLWNRAVPAGSTFTPYTSSTMDTSPGNPSPISLLCLGCHDGVNAYYNVNGNSVSTKHDLLNYHGDIPDTSSYPNCGRCHGSIYGGGYDTEEKWRLGTDLSDDHPISMTYPTQAQDPKFNIPSDIQNGWSDVRLVDGKVECVSCHDVHDPSNPPFLVKSNAGSGLCLTCHNM